MIVISNNINTNQVRRETDNNTEYLVAPVVLARAMALNGGYLPRDEIKASAPRWAGTPAPIDHPTHSGDPISINDDRADVPIIGEVRNPQAKNDGEFLTGELWINIQTAQTEQEGERILARIQNGDAVEVSTGHVPGRVVSGVFDGEHRDAATLDIQPDHLAVLPNDKGRCSIADHCGAGAPVAPVANRVMVANMADDGPHQPEEAGDPIHNKTVAGVTFTGTASGTLDEAAIPNDDFEPHYLFDGDTKSESSYPVVDADGDLRRGNVESAFQVGARGGVTRSELHGKLSALNDEFNDPPIDPDKLETNALQRAYNALKDVFGESSETTTPAEPGTDNNTPSMGDLENESMIEELAANTEFDRENLIAWDGTDCLANLHQKHIANEGGGGSEATGQGTEPNDTVDVKALADELSDQFVTTDDLSDAISDAITANREREQKHDLAEDIAANTDEYDDAEAVIEDYPTVAALETKRDDVTEPPVANYGATRTVRASFGDSDKTPDWSPVASAHAAKQQEADD